MGGFAAGLSQTRAISPGAAPRWLYFGHFAEQLVIISYTVRRRLCAAISASSSPHSSFL